VALVSVSLVLLFRRHGRHSLRRTASLSLRLCPGRPRLCIGTKEDVDARHKAGHDEIDIGTTSALGESALMEFGSKIRSLFKS
jgi:hypothetical protein